MRPGAAAVCRGEVRHRRRTPAVHAFGYRVSYVWLDPDVPEELCDPHPLWSCRRPAPARFRRTDYGTDPSERLGDRARTELAPLAGHRPTGEVRMLTQIRRWGWLFNPITVYVVWDDDPETPLGAVLEVTNTPWKERHRYPVLLTPVERDGNRELVGSVAKSLHVSPFLDEDHRYEIRLLADGDDALAFVIDVIPTGADEPILETQLRVGRAPVNRATLGRALVADVAPTHRVSFGIHLQAFRLWWKRVLFVPHPSKRSQIA